MSAFDALEVGRPKELGAYRFDEDDALDFARRFDPLALLPRPESSTPTVSPWQVAAAFMRLNVLFHEKRAELVFGPSPGVSDMVWHRPVEAGETLRYSQTVIAKRRTARREGWGLLTTAIEARDEGGALVFSMTGRVLVRSD